jgi:hypothetical protein
MSVQEESLSEELESIADIINADDLPDAPDAPGEAYAIDLYGSKGKELPNEKRAYAIKLGAMSEDQLVAWTASAIAEREHVSTVLGDYINAGKQEIERRLKENGGRAIAHPAAEKIELEEQFAQYVWDMEALRAAARWLRERGKDVQAAKIIKHVEEQTTIQPAHDEPGAPVSVNALLREYGETSDLGKLLKKAMTRDKTGERLIFKIRAGA